MIFLPHTNTVILLEPYCGTITEPGLPVVQAGSTDTFCRKLQGAHQDSSIKNYVKYKVSASIVISWGLSS